MAYIPSMNRRLMTIVETPPYLARVAKLMNGEERNAVVDLVAADPECGVVMRGTGGVRKVRFAIGGRGKSAGVRIIYYFHNESIPLFLLTVFAKNEKANLTQAERNALAALTDILVKTYRR